MAIPPNHDTKFTEHTSLVKPGIEDSLFTIFASLAYSVFDCATKIYAPSLKDLSTINYPKEFEPDVLNSLCGTGSKKSKFNRECLSLVVKTVNKFHKLFKSLKSICI